MGMSIRYVLGDATGITPKPDRSAVIGHCCNDAGYWGAGFVLALSERWPEPEAAFRAAQPLRLGAAQFVPIPTVERLWVANLVGQHNIRRGQGGRPPIRYDALGDCLTQLGAWARDNDASVHLPRIGAGLAGGHWPTIAGMIEERLKGLDVAVYDFAP